MSQYSDTILAEPGVVGYWRLGELTGTSIVDSKSGNNGTATNSPTLGVAPLISDDPNAAMAFVAGSNQYVDIPAGSYGFGNGPYAGECWFSMSGSGANFTVVQIPGIIGVSGSIGIKLGPSANGKVSVTDGANRIITSGASPLYNDGKRHHALFGKTVGNVWSLIIDGVDVTNADAFPSQTTITGTNHGSVGTDLSSGSPAQSLTGTVDEFAIYNVAPTVLMAYRHFTMGLQSNTSYRPLITTRIGPRPLRLIRLRYRPSAPNVVSGPIQTPVTLTATLSFAGSQVKQTARTAAGSLGFTGALPKNVGKPLAGVLSFTGSLTRRAGKALSGGLSFAGSLPRAVARTLTAGLSFAGSLPRAITRGLAATLSFTGSIQKRTARTMTGVLSFSGSVATLKAFNVALSATLSFTGSVQRRTGKALAGGVSFAGSVQRAVAHGMTASLSFTGSLTKRSTRALNATLSFVGNVSTLKAFNKLLTATLSFTGTQTRRVSKTLSGGLTFAGSVTKRIGRPLAGVLSFTGALQRQTGKTLAATLTFTGAITKRTSKTLTGALSFIGTAGRLFISGVSVIGGLARPFATAIHGIPGAIARHGTPAGSADRTAATGDAEHGTPGGSSDHPTPGASAE